LQTLTLSDLEVPEDAFVVRLRRGERAAIGAAYDLHQEAVCSFAKRLLRDTDAAEDLVQDVFETLPSVAHRLSSESCLRSFLLGIAANRAQHCARSFFRRSLFTRRLATVPPPEAENPEEGVERRRLADALGRALDTLAIEQRVTFVLVEIEGYSGTEVAELLGVPESTVRTRMFHARRKLRTHLSAEGIR